MTVILEVCHESCAFLLTGRFVAGSRTTQVASRRNAGTGRGTQGNPSDACSRHAEGGWRTPRRLVRKIRDACAEEWRPDDEQFFSLGLDLADFSGVVFRLGSGCPACLTTGYRGRKAVYEVIAADREIRELVRSNAGSAEITEASRKAGNVSLFAAGVEAVRNGVTTFS